VPCIISQSVAVLRSCAVGGSTLSASIHLPLAQAATIAQALAEGRCDFGFLHVKAVDDTGHDRAAALKVRQNVAKQSCSDAPVLESLWLLLTAVWSSGLLPLGCGSL